MPVSPLFSDGSSLKILIILDRMQIHGKEGVRAFHCKVYFFFKSLFHIPTVLTCPTLSSSACSSAICFCHQVSDEIRHRFLVRMESLQMTSLLSRGTLHILKDWLMSLCIQTPLRWLAVTLDQIPAMVCLIDSYNSMFHLAFHVCYEWSIIING